MGKEIRGSSTTGKFNPSVRLEAQGEFIKGTIVDARDLPPDSYGHKNRAISIQLIDLNGGSVQRSVAKGQYEEVEVSEGDVVDFVGRGTDLREKIPQLKVGDVVTITQNGEAPNKRKGQNAKKLFKVEVE